MLRPPPRRGPFSPLKARIIFAVALASTLAVLAALAILMPRKAHAAGVATADLMRTVVLLSSPQGHGSGVLVGRKLILTAAHVARHDTLIAESIDGMRTPTQALWLDNRLDLALLLARDDLHQPAARLACSGVLSVDEPLRLIGHPKGLRWFVARGHRGTYQPLTRLYRPHLLIDATVYLGDSGGGAFGADGRLWGVIDGLLTHRVMTPYGGFWTPLPIAVAVKASGACERVAYWRRWLS